jgi:leukotriene-A4 hydrolase
MVLILFSKVLSCFSFDTSYLHIEGVKVEGDAVHDVRSVYAQCLDFLSLYYLQFILDPKHAVMGSALRVPLSRTVRVGSSISVEIAYSTTANGTALQFLEKE